MRKLCVFVSSAVLVMHVSIAPCAAVDSPSRIGPSFTNQLWRMTGRLTTRDGRAFSYAANFFRYAEPHGVVICAASLSILDEASHRLYSERRTERAGFGLADAATASLAIHVGAWRLRQSSLTGTPFAFDLGANLDGVALGLRNIAHKRRSAFRSATSEHDGYSSVASTGTLSIDGRRLAVSGKSWLDRERSNVAPSTSVLGSQYRVQLDDGREVFIEGSLAPSAHAAPRRAYLVERDGTVLVLRPGAYEFGGHPGSTWNSPQTRTIYPDIWGLHVDDKTAFLSLEPVSVDQESLANGNGRSYWDGAVDVYDVTPGSQGLRLGSGYVLMTGYTPRARTR